MRIAAALISILLFLTACHKDSYVPVVPPVDEPDTVIPVDPVDPVDPVTPEQHQIKFDIGTTEYSIEIGGVQRNFYVQIPAGFDSTQTYPVLLALKGKSDGDDDYGLWISKLSSTIDSRHYIGVYPKNRNGQWNIGNIGGDPMEDIDFISAIVEVVKNTGVVNDHKIYCMGVSNGGCMTQYLAIHTDYFAAITTIAGSLFEGVWQSSGSEVSVLHIHGELDNSVPYAGGRAHNLQFYSAPKSIGLWAAHNGCSAPPDTDLTIPDATVLKYNHCNPNIETILFSVPDAGHAIYSSYDAIDLNGYIFDFFDRHSL